MYKTKSFKKSFKKKSGVRRSYPRRKLGIGATASTIASLAPYAQKAVRAGMSLYKARSQRASNLSKQKRNESLMLSDNIGTIPTTIVGKSKPLSFDEKVSRVDRPPILFKRNYEFSAEVNSGRKGWFNMEFNIVNSNDLNADLTTYKSQQYTDTATADPSAPLNAFYDGAKFYVDYLNEKLSFVNSSSSALTGKIHLFAHKRDSTGYAGAPMTPVNMMMYYSTFRLPQNVTANEATIGNGWKFDTATANLNWQAVYNMPGSSLNASGVCAFTDTALNVNSPHIADGLSFWFRKVSSTSFSLKPGQQINKTYTFNDLKDIMREEQSSYTYLAGVTFSCVVEFVGQIVGDGLNSNISSSFTQLSVMRQSTRKIGIRNKIKSKVYLITAPPVTILPANTVIINPDLGQLDSGVDYDFN